MALKVKVQSKTGVGLCCNTKKYYENQSKEQCKKIHKCQCTNNSISKIAEGGDQKVQQGRNDTKNQIQ